MEGATTVQRTVTVLRGRVQAQLELHDLLRRLLGLDLKVIRVRVLAHDPVAGGSETAGQGPTIR